MVDVQQLRDRDLDRVHELRPSMDCGLTPRCDGIMLLRRSVVTNSKDDPYVLDIQLKCSKCRATQKHGYGITRSEYQEELELRGGDPEINYVSDWESDQSVDDQLAALGYKEL